MVTESLSSTKPSAQKSSELFLNADFGKNDPIWKLAHDESGKSFIPEILIQKLIQARNYNRNMFVRVEGEESTLSIKPWEKSAEFDPPTGGGVISVMRGQILEKAAVNMSIVKGDRYPAIESEHANKPFVAAGVSLITHPFNPHAPIAHMNVRILTVGEGENKVTWIGGGADLTPLVNYPDDTLQFHAALESVCIRHRLGNYPAFKKWCDDYFYITHRKEIRGVGGIFFDYLKVQEPTDYDFLVDLTMTFCDIYEKILNRRTETPFDAALKEKHLWWRGRYAEFNLAYDRGTRFGLLSGGNTEAIFCSLPPVVKW